MKIKFLLSIFFLLFIIISYFGFKFYNKSQIINEKKFGNILTYLHIINISNTLNNDKNNDKKIFTILKIFKVSPNSFKKSTNYYLKNLSKLKNVYKYTVDEISLQKALLNIE